jgi:hypothetical protein
MLKSICEVLDLERSGVNSELVKRILNFLMHPKPSGKVRATLYLPTSWLSTAFPLFLSPMTTSALKICLPLTELQYFYNINQIAYLNVT